MKKIFFLIVILILTLKVSSQNYVKMISDSIFWDINYAIMGNICDGYGGGGARFCFGHDTIINSYNYTNFRVFGMRSVYYPTVDCPPYLVDTVSSNLHYYLREDSTGKIYFYNYINQIESLWFDYNLHIGDSLIYDSGNIFFIDTIITNTGIDGISRREYFDYTSYTQGHFVEGLGGPAGPMYEPFNYFENGPWCTCIGYFNDTSNYCYDFISNNQNIVFNNSSLFVYPTIAHNFITISDISSIKSIRIINLFGIEFYKTNSIESNQINIENLHNGIYFVEIKLKNNLLITRKIIKNSL